MGIDFLFCDSKRSTSRGHRKKDIPKREHINRFAHKGQLGVDFRSVVALRTLVVVPESFPLFLDRINPTKVNYLDPRIHVRELEWSIKHDVLKLQVKVEQSK
jgi:hypothetical protein